MEKELADILEQLKTSCSLNEAIFADQEGDKPKCPFVTAKIISNAGNNSQGLYTRSPVESSGQQFAYDIELTYYEEQLTTISFSVYAKDSEESERIAKDCAAWFKFFGQEFLKSMDIVVVEIGLVSNRDTLVITDYERRYGFDVTLRSTVKLKKNIPTIESVQVNNEEIKL